MDAAGWVEPDMVTNTQSGLVRAINYLLDTAGVNFSVSGLEEVTESLFVILLELLVGETLPDIRRCVEAYDDHVHNAQVLLSYLGETIFMTPLAHLDAALLVQGDVKTIYWLTEIMFGLYATARPVDELEGSLMAFTSFCPNGAPDDAIEGSTVTEDSYDGSTVAMSRSESPQSVPRMSPSETVPIGMQVTRLLGDAEMLSPEKTARVASRRSERAREPVRADPGSASPVQREEGKKKTRPRKRRPGKAPASRTPAARPAQDVDFVLSALMQKHTMSIRRRRELLSMGGSEQRTAMLQETLGRRAGVEADIMGESTRNVKIKARGKYQQLVMDFLKMGGQAAQPRPLHTPRRPEGTQGTGHVLIQDRMVDREVRRMKHQTEARRAQTEEKVFRELYTGALAMERRHLQAEEKLRREVAVKQRDIERAAEKAMECQYEGRIGLLKEEIGRLRTGQKKEATSVQAAMKYVTKESEDRHRSTVKGMLDQLRQLNDVEQNTSRFSADKLAGYVLAAMKGTDAK